MQNTETNSRDIVARALAEHPNAGRRKIAELTGLGLGTVERELLKLRAEKEVSAMLPTLPGRIELGEDYMAIPEDATDEELRQTFHALRRVDSALNWWIGDLLTACQQLRGEERATAFLEEWGRSEATAYNAWFVCRNMEPLSRVKGSTFTHHLAALQECGDVEEACEWLAVAVEERLTVSGMRKAIRDAKKGKDNQPDKQDFRVRFAPLYAASTRIVKIPVHELSPTDRQILRNDLAALRNWLDSI